MGQTVIVLLTLSSHKNFYANILNFL